MKRPPPDGLAMLARDERFEAKLRRAAEWSPEYRARRLAELDRREMRREVAARDVAVVELDDLDGVESVDADRGDEMPSVRMYGKV